MGHPITPHEERLWFIDEFERGNVYRASPTYHNIPLILHGTQPLPAGLVTMALQTIVDSHPELRARIRSTPLGAEKWFDECGREQAINARELGANVQIDDAFEIAINESQIPFQMASDALIRASMLYFGQSEYLLVITVHHIIADVTSMKVLAKQLGEVISASALSVLSPSSISSGPFPAVVECNGPQLEYWKGRLAGKIAVLELPLARPRPAVHTFTAARKVFSLGSKLSAEIRAFAERMGLSVFSVTLAGFNILLYKYARQKEIVVGTTASRRNSSNQSFIGVLSNLIVLRSILEDDDSFQDVAKNTEEIYREARENCDVSFDLLVRELDPEIDMSRTALFDVHFAVDTDDSDEIDIGDWGKLKIIHTNLGYGKYDISLSLKPDQHGAFNCYLVYNADFHDAWFAEQLVHHFVSVLENGLLNAEMKIEDLPLLSTAEESQQLISWNRTDVDAPRDKTIDALFSHQVTVTPERIALSLGDEHISYHELEKRANRLANHLACAKVRPDDLVAMCLERSIDLVVAILGILKAGAAYLPLDPLHPKERIDFVLKDAGVKCLVTTDVFAKKIAFADGPLICLDTEAEDIAQQPSTAPQNGATAKNLAYCIYTSGSTGDPKGALVEHRQVTRLIKNDKDSFSFSDSDVWTLFHSCCFDFSVWEIFGALLHGARLVIVPQQIAQDPGEMVEFVAREQVTVFNQTPTSFYNFSREALREKAPSLNLRLVIFGGESLAPLRLKMWKRANPNVRLVNMYGITETTVHVTIADVTDEDIESNINNIGRPIPTTTTYLFDTKRRLLPIGVAGEICVGGEGVCRGYLNRDALTNQRFISNPYRLSERLYCSGDLAYYCPDGRMVYVGRIDDQVQIRGFRVELGEVKTHLLKYPSVTDAEVIACVLHEGLGLELVAYLVTAEQLKATDVRRYLLQKLPDYMVPSAFVLLSALPLTSNGKIDRRSLPEPDFALQDDRIEGAVPRDAVEEKLTILWTELLKRPVGIRDNFFAIGGHSILAAQFRASVRESFGIELPLRHLFETPTIEQLGPLINNKLKSENIAFNLDRVIS